MLSSAVVDVAIAVLLTFALSATAASAVVEWIGNLTRKRAKYLLRGLHSMLDAADSMPPAPAPAPAEAGTGARAPGWDATAILAAIRRLGSGVRAEKDLYAYALKPTGEDVTALHESERGIPGGLTALLFDHPLLRSTMQPTRSAAATRTRVPPYVSSEVFARTLLDTLAPGDGQPLTLDRVRAAVTELHPALPARSALLALLDQAVSGLGSTVASGRSTLDGFVTDVEKWYDAQMDRVSGWYKRWAKRWIIVIAAVICLAANVDALAIARTLYSDPVLRTSVVAEVQQGRVCGTATAKPEDQVSCVRDVVSATNGPGLMLWPRGCLADLGACVARPGHPAGGGDWLLKLLGLAVTIAAASMGAPFWFELLNRLVNLRNTGKIPAAKT